MRILFLLAAAAAAQQTDPLLRVTVTLVQVDAVVTDSRGRHVTDLKPEDFELRQDGRPRKITHFSYVSTTPAPTPAGAPPIRSIPLQPEHVRRTIAVVVDDLGLSSESIERVRHALRKLIETRLQPGDLMAILRTGSSTGGFDRFTSDKRALFATADSVRWLPYGRGPDKDNAADAGGIPLSEAEVRLRENAEEFWTVGTLGSIRMILRGLQEMPGRKSLVLLTDNLAIRNSQGFNQRMSDLLDRLSDKANRAGTVIYTINPRGVSPLTLAAADNDRSVAGKRKREWFTSEEGLHHLAQQTGGLYVRDNNDVSAALGQVLEDQPGYYLIGYAPEEGTFRPGGGREKFHRTSLKVLRRGLTVRSRAGFYGVADTARPPAPQTREQQIAAALLSPFGASGVRVRLTSLFADGPQTGPFVHSLLHIDPRDLQFTEEPGGVHRAVIDVVTQTVASQRDPAGQVARTYSIRLNQDQYQVAQRRGFVYGVQHPVKKAGVFHMRAVVRDAATGRTGSAGQVVEVPPVDKGAFALSGIMMQAADAELVKDLALPEGAVAQGSPALRRFAPGQPVTYVFQILNPRRDRSTGRPDVEWQARVHCGGELVHSGQPGTSSIGDDPKRPVAVGLLRLGSQMAPGGYTLEIVATDRLRKTTAKQWIDFEIAP